MQLISLDCCLKNRNSDVLDIIKKYGLLAVPVVTEDSRLVGILTFDDVMSHL
nr:CBS domain-containing protein [Paenibacillus alvei]